MFNLLESTLKGIEPAEKQGGCFQIRWQWLAEGVMTIEPVDGYQRHLILSAGIHGNETAPIEILNDLVTDILAGKCVLKARLMVIFGNPPAMRSGERYQQIDLNRLFSGKHAQYDSCYETERAKLLESFVTEFFSQNDGLERIHHDLHTAIRESNYQRFGLLPYLNQGSYSRPMLDWLHHAGLDALVINHAPSGTFTYFTSQHAHAASCTLELGKARPFGQNDLNQFALIKHGLISLVSGVNCLPVPSKPLKVYRVTQELIKHTNAFRLKFPEHVKNFTCFPEGTILAQDGDISYRVVKPVEWIIFPNAAVRPGLRAGLMLTETSLDSLFG